MHPTYSKPATPFTWGKYIPETVTVFVKLIEIIASLLTIINITDKLVFDFFVKAGKEFMWS